MRRNKLFAALLYMFVAVFFFPQLASAQLLPFTQFDLNQVNRSQNYRDPESINECSSSASASLNEPLEEGAQIYFLGDSLLVLSENEFTAAFAPSETGEPSNTISGYNADSGRAITYDSAGNEPTGIEAVQQDASIIGSSDAVVVALGTNSGNEELREAIPQLAEEIRDTGFDGTIYWVNLFYADSESRDARNAVIDTMSSQQNYVIVDALSSDIPLSDDGVHPSNPEGNQAFAQAIASQLRSLPTANAVPAQQTTGLCQCASPGSLAALSSTIQWGEGVWGAGAEIYQSGLTGPYTIEQWAIHVLRNIARKTGLPESQMVTQQKVVSLVAWAQAEGGGVSGHNGTFNPLNTKLSHADLQGSNQGSASNDSNSQGYPTFDLGVEAVTRALFNTFQKRIGSSLLVPGLSGEDFIEAVAGDFEAVPFGSSSASSVVNNLEDLYPGDRAYATLSITGFRFGPGGTSQNGGLGDRDLYVSIKRSTLENARENYEEYAGRILDEPGGISTGTPQPLVYGSGGGTPSAYSGGECQQAGGTAVNDRGYAFPIAPATKSSVRMDWTHYDDGTAAVDIASYQENAPVYAIDDAIIDRVNTNFNDVSECSTIMLLANPDEDGLSYYYFYGHITNVLFEEGDAVRAGQQIAEVADSDRFDSNCWGGEPHLHIDRGCIIDGVPQRGGGQPSLDGPGIPSECRDPEFVTLLREIYEEIPD